VSCVVVWCSCVIGVRVCLGFLSVLVVWTGIMRQEMGSLVWNVPVPLSDVSLVMEIRFAPAATPSTISPPLPPTHANASTNTSSPPPPANYAPSPLPAATNATTKPSVDTATKTSISSSTKPPTSASAILTITWVEGNAPYVVSPWSDVLTALMPLIVKVVARSSCSITTPKSVYVGKTPLLMSIRPVNCVKLKWSGVSLVLMLRSVPSAGRSTTLFWPSTISVCARMGMLFLISSGVFLAPTRWWAASCAHPFKNVIHVTQLHILN